MVSTTTQLPAAQRSTLKTSATLTIIIGLIALAMPFLAGIAATYFLAANFVIGGILMSFSAFRATRWAGALGLMVLGIVGVLAGLSIFLHPLTGLATITMFSIVAMFVSGIVKIFWTTELPPGNGRSLLTVSGSLSIVVAAMLYANFPFSALWAFGVLVGINLLVEGVSLWVFVRNLD